MTDNRAGKSRKLKSFVFNSLKMGAKYVTVIYAHVIDYARLAGKHTLLLSDVKGLFWPMGGGGEGSPGGVSCRERLRGKHLWCGWERGVGA